jgi:hypothetical protein
VSFTMTTKIRCDVAARCNCVGNRKELYGNRRANLDTLERTVRGKSSSWSIETIARYLRSVGVVDRALS